MEEKFMRRALELARKGEGFTSPNPCVGAVIVKNGKVIGKGWHKKAGGNHAEIEAIRDSGCDFFDDAEMYVTMEPCAHEGRTGACAGAIAEARFKKVFVGMKDPSKKVNGQGIEYLKNKGVKVKLLNSLSDIYKKILLLNQPFIKTVGSDIPYIVMKAGMSFDGKIALDSGESKWITSSQSRDDAREERGKCDAVLAGYNTVLLDDPSLSPGGRFSDKKLLKIVLDPLLKSDLQKKVLRDENVFVACTESASTEDRKRFDDAGIDFDFFGETDVSLKNLFSYLKRQRNVQSVFVEGGSETHGSFLDKQLVDKVIFYVAPKLLGGRDNKSVIGGKGVSSISESIKLENLKISKMDEDIKLEGLVLFYSE